MGRAEDVFNQALESVPRRPADDASRADKRRYSELLSAAVALAFADELRHRGMAEARPGPPGPSGSSGAERRIAGGIGAKKVDVTWATEESGLLLGISVKGINFKDQKTGNFQKNLTNRRGDMLIEAVTLHRRFPYAVLAGVLFFDKEAADDGSDRRRSTFTNANQRMRSFTGRADPTDRDEQFERLFLALIDSDGDVPVTTFYRIGDRPEPVTLSALFDELIELLADRNPDFYEVDGGSLAKVSS